MTKHVERSGIRRASCVLLVGLCVGAGALAADLTLTWWTIDAGGETGPSGAGLSLSGTIGQPDAGPLLSAGSLELVGGFWGGPAGGTAGDCDGDVTIGAGDALALMECLSGPQTQPAQGCTCADYDGDDDVDLADVAAAQRAFGI